MSAANDFVLRPSGVSRRVGTIAGTGGGGGAATNTTTIATSSAVASQLLEAPTVLKGHHHHLLDTSSASSRDGAPIGDGTTILVSGHDTTAVGGSSVGGSTTIVQLLGGGRMAGSVGSGSPLTVAGAVPHVIAVPPTASAAAAGNRFLQTPLLYLVWQRLSVLVSLLLLQSLSQFVLESYEGLISNNVVVPLFLTMLVGAGGNAGNQAAVHAITGLVTGELRPSHLWPLLKRELAVGLVSSSALFLIGFLRVYYYYTNEEVQPTPVFTTVLSVSMSLFLIVLSSVLLGAALPFVLKALRLDVEHAAPMIQVVMDIMGVCIACVVCSAFLPSVAPSSSTPMMATPPSGRPPQPPRLK